MPYICRICHDVLTTIVSTIDLSAASSTESEIICTFQCGHIFHLSCLPDVFVTNSTKTVVKPRQAYNCPCCSKNVEMVIRLYPAEEEETMSDRSLATEKKMQDEIFQLKAKIRNLEMAGSRGQSRFLEPEPSETSVHFNQATVVTTISNTQNGLTIGSAVVWLRGDDDDSVENGTVQWLGEISEHLFAGVDFENPIGNYVRETSYYPNIRCRDGHGRLLRVQELISHSDFYGEQDDEDCDDDNDILVPFS